MPYLENYCTTYLDSLSRTAVVSDTWQSKYHVHFTSGFLLLSSFHRAGSTPVVSGVRETAYIYVYNATSCQSRAYTVAREADHDYENAYIQQQ